MGAAILHGLGKRRLSDRKLAAQKTRHEKRMRFTECVSRFHLSATPARRIEIFGSWRAFAHRDRLRKILGMSKFLYAMARITLPERAGCV